MSRAAEISTPERSPRRILVIHHDRDDRSSRIPTWISCCHNMTVGGRRDPLFTLKLEKMHLHTGLRRRAQVSGL